MDAEAERKAHKRQKLTDTLQSTPAPSEPPSTPQKSSVQINFNQAQNLVKYVKALSRRDLSSQEKIALKRAAHGLSEHAKKEDRINVLVDAGAIHALVPLLTLFAPRESESCPGSSSAEEIEKEACYILSLLANKTEFQLKMAELGALGGLVAILKRYAPLVHNTRVSSSGVSLIRRAADAITNMAHENVTIKARVRMEDGIAPLVTLLDAVDIKIQRAAASALRTLAFKNESNKDNIVECGALPTLIHMLHAEDTGIHYEAVGVIGNLVHSSQHIKRSVLEIGALQPIISLLSSKCQDAQREAALLIGQFATVDNVYKARIVQRGAVPPLVEMLKIEDRQLREMAAFAIGRVAQNEDNQAGIVQAGGLSPLLELISSNDGNLQHNAAFALYGLADNPDNVPAFIREGAVQTLLDCQSNSQGQASRDCIQKTLKRLEEKLQGPVLNKTLYLLHSPHLKVQQRSATAFAVLLKADFKKAFVDRPGLEILMRMIKDCPTNPSPQKEAAVALYELAVKAAAVAPVEGPPAPAADISMGPEYLNSEQGADVIFLVEGRQFPAHRFCLQQASEAFRAMFEGNYKEKNAAFIPIPNIQYEVFEAMMRCIYTGQNTVAPSMAEDLLAAADQYMLHSLKRGCEEELAGQLSLTTVYQMYQLSRLVHAPNLAAQCVLFTLQHYDQLSQAQQDDHFFQAALEDMVPTLGLTIKEQLCKSAG